MVPALVLNPIMSFGIIIGTDNASRDLNVPDMFLFSRSKVTPASVPIVNRIARVSTKVKGRIFCSKVVGRVIIIKKKKNRKLVLAIKIIQI